MNELQKLFLGLLISAAFAFTARADGLSINLVDFQKIGINGRPARMILITSLPVTGLLDPEAKRLGLNGPGTWVDALGVSIRMSELTQVMGGGQTVLAPILIARLPWWGRLASKFISIPVDGAVGWPEVRDNILVFDSDLRTIRRVEQLPPETSAWLKLKVVPDDFLLLELPLADGEMSTVWVDTASKGCIAMPPAQWKEWTAAHPHPAKADEIKLSALTLTDVAVKEMPAAEAEDLLSETPAATVVWKFGMAALMRMDLVVDGNNGWAYLCAKPTTGPSKNKASAENNGGDWKVAENVRVNGDNLFVYSGFYKLYKCDFAGALADFNRALELNPRNAGAYS